MLRVVNFVLGPLRTNTYLITDEETGASLVIDPSFGSEQVAAYAAREQIHIDKILLTHGHNDHVAGVPALQRQYKEIPLYIRKEDTFYLKKEGDEDSDFMGMPRPFIHGPFHWLQDRDTVSLGTSIFQVIATPGHTPGSVCYYQEDRQWLFSGDTLFAGSAGRCDLPLGDEEKLADSLGRLKQIIPDSAIILPGHGEHSEMGLEKINNPFLRGGL